MKNMLKLDSKTEFFIVASSHNMSKLSDINFQIGSEVITPSPKFTKTLGITFDSAMTMSDQIMSHLCVNLSFWNHIRIGRLYDHNAASTTISYFAGT